MIQSIFYILCAVILIGATLVVTLRNLFHCALALALTMFCVAGVYVYLGWEFLAGVQILIYVGAVTVLIIFGIMLTRRVMDEHTPALNRFVGWALGGIVVWGVVLFSALDSSPIPTWVENVGGASTYTSDVTMLAAALLKPQNGFDFAFEFVSVLLLSALVGAVVIARKDPS